MGIDWLYNLLILGVLTILLVILFIWILEKYIHHLKSVHRQVTKNKANVCHVGIFHPYANAGGGGERVLWCAIRALQDRYINNYGYIEEKKILIAGRRSNTNILYSKYFPGIKIK